MLRRLGDIVLFAAILFAVAGFSTAGYYKYRAGTLALAKDSVEAAGDIQRSIAAELGDSLTAVTLRAVQTRIERDELDKLLRSRSTGRTSVTVAVKPLEMTVGTVANGTGVHEAYFEQLYREPYRIDSLRVQIPNDTSQRPGFRLALRLDPADLHVRNTCELDGADGVHRARTSVTGPDWLSINIRSTVQDPKVCSPQAVRITNGPRLGPAVRAGLWAVVGIVMWEGAIRPAIRE